MNYYVEDIVSYKNSEISINDIRSKFAEFLQGEEIPKYFKNSQNKEGETKPTIKSILDILGNKDNNNTEESINLPKEYKSIMSFDYLLLNILNFLKNKDDSLFKQGVAEITMSNANLISEFDKFDIENKATEFMKNLLKFRLIFDYFVFKRDENEVYFKDMNFGGILKVTEPKELSMIELLFHHMASNYNAQEWVQDVFKFILDNDMKLKTELSLIDDLERKDKEKAKSRENKNLDSGTATPHHWFYRLEYLLWKELDKNDGIWSNLKDKQERQKLYANYTISRLNSIEHIQPQSKGFENNENIDIFGNLALLSSSRNSSLGNLEVNEKKTRIENWLQGKYNPQSLKMILALKNYPEWNFGNAYQHGEAMKKLLGLEQNSEK